MSDMATEGRRYQVVVNHEEQYSIWSSEGNPPDGWRSVGFRGEKDACLGYIAEVWTDMRPLSRRSGADSSVDQSR
ncbi:MbtH family protein [Streptomyces sp. NPDC006602]|uniref:MbtH family protein n=1 Tax=Streptomyces sp. NPDC006602 TaxID=3364751 RepID=UPI0036BE0A32